MNIVDSSGWLEYFADTPQADVFAPAIENTEKLIVPSVSVYEVFKKVLREKGEDLALQATALMRQGQVVDLDCTIALQASRLSLHYKLPMADSIMLSSALHYKAVLWTQDADFQGIDSVKYFQKKS